MHKIRKYKNMRRCMRTHTLTHAMRPVRGVIQEIPYLRTFYPEIAPLDRRRWSDDRLNYNQRRVLD